MMLCDVLHLATTENHIVTTYLYNVLTSIQLLYLLQLDEHDPYNQITGELFGELLREIKKHSSMQVCV